MSTENTKDKPNLTSENIFAIIKISYNPHNGQAEGGICGSCFFVTRNKFVTAHHCFNQEVFQPNKGYKKVKVFLSGCGGSIIENPKIHLLKLEYDLAIGEVSKAVENYFPLTSNSVSKNDGVYCLGYSAQRALKKYKLSIENGRLLVSNLSLSVEKQEGTIRDIKSATVRAQDINFSNLEVLILSYKLERGFSGAPLFSKDGNQIIGFMSMVIPANYDPQNSAVAIPIEHWKRLL